MADGIRALRDRGLEAWHAWLHDRGEAAATRAGTLFMWGAAAHAAYCVLVPAPLREPVVRRNVRRAQAASLLAVVATGAYDLLQSQRLEAERSALAAEHRRLVRQLAAGGSGGGGAAGSTAAEWDDEGGG